MRAAAVIAAFLMSGCALAVTSPNIADLKYDPARYHNRNVSVEGVVTTSWDLPLLPFSFYKVADRTGEVLVLSQGRRTPVRGAHVRVRGRVDEIGIVGGRPVGLHIRERSLHVRRR
jgi:hypothetical protein